jgi:hypothetical protein
MDLNLPVVEDWQGLGLVGEGGFFWKWNWLGLVRDCKNV